MDSPLSRFIPTLAPANYSEQFKREIYARFHRLILRPKCARMWGFPYVDDKDGGKVKFHSSRFSKAGKSSNTETCRCGKNLFLDTEDWHLDAKGCEFHPGKFLYSESAQTEIYTCCKRDWAKPGCVRRQHHVSSHRACSGDDFVRTSGGGPKQQRLLSHLPNIFALDCEMVYTTRGMEVAKVTVLTVFCDVVYDALVQPRDPIIDYNTEFSGIDEPLLRGCTVSLEQVQKDLLELFDAQTILVGHGLENDLLCLNLQHAKVIDTSVLYPHRMGFPYRHSLKQLAMDYLGKTIHSDPKRGHDSREDARTCIELVALKIFVCKTKGRDPLDFQSMQSQMAANLIPNSIPRKFYGPPPGYAAYPPLAVSPPNRNQFVNMHQQHPLLSYPLVSMNMPKRQNKRLLIPLP